MYQLEGVIHMVFLVPGKKKQHSKAYTYFGISLLFSAVLLFLSRNVNGFAQWYATYIFPQMPNTLGRLFSPVPFSGFEMGLYLLLISGFSAFVFVFYFILKKPINWQNRLSRLGRISLCTVSSLFLLFTLTCAVNYSRDTFAESYGLPVHNSTNEDLKKLCLILIQDLKELTPQLEFDENGILSLEKVNIGEDARASMEKIGQRYPTLSGYYPKPKPVLFSKGMSYLGITGIYSPFTMEANYNDNISPYIIPYTTCHELAHLKGYMKEDEAGFIAYEASRNSDSKVFQYSGALNALVFSLNALYANVSIDEFKAIYSEIPSQARMELQQSRLYWKEHTAPITSVAKAANDKYLMANAQAAGTKSYGIMVDLLLAAYADELEEDLLL